VGPVVVDRLRDGEDVVAVLRGRQQRAGDLVVVHVRAHRTAGPPRVAVVASRKVGKAVARNRAKRLLREAARHLPWRAGLDVVLVARSACAERGFAEVHQELRALAARLGALEEPS
jgi:ribonuclease P protein component